MSRPHEQGLHPLDVTSLVAGLLAVAVALVALLDVDVDGAVVVPVLLLAAGAAGLLLAVRRLRGGDGADA